MNVGIKLKSGKGFGSPQPLATKEWENGILLGATTAADNRSYAVVQTEHGEFDLLPWYEIIAADSVSP